MRDTFGTLMLGVVVGPATGVSEGGIDGGSLSMTPWIGTSLNFDASTVLRCKKVQAQRCYAAIDRAGCGTATQGNTA